MEFGNVRWASTNIFAIQHESVKPMLTQQRESLCPLKSVNGCLDKTHEQLRNGTSWQKLLLEQSYMIWPDATASTDDLNAHRHPFSGFSEVFFWRYNAVKVPCGPGELA